MAPPRVVVFDLETTAMVDFAYMPSARVSVAVAKLAHSSSYVDAVLTGDPEQHRALLEPFASFLDTADYVIAHNGHTFDIRVLQNYFAPDRVAAWKAKLIDLKAKFQNVARNNGGTLTSLNALLSANDLKAKTGDGGKAVADWNAGRHGEVLAYCRSDVDLLCALWEKRYISVSYRDGTRNPTKFDLHKYMAEAHRESLFDEEYKELYGAYPQDAEEEDIWQDCACSSWSGDALVSCHM